MVIRCRVMTVPKRVNLWHRRVRDTVALAFGSAKPAALRFVAGLDVISELFLSFGAMSD